MQATIDPRIEADFGTNVGSAIEIRPPSRRELTGCRMLLPEAFRTGRPPDLLLAAGVNPFRYLGVLAYELVHLGGRLGWRIAVHVARSARGRGVGGRLIAAIAERGRRRGVAFLAAEIDAEDRPAAGFLGASGFRLASTCSKYEGDLARYRDVVGPIRDRLAARGRIPGEARVVPPDRAPAEGLRRLAEGRAASGFLAAGDLSAEFWRRPSVRDASAVLMLGDRFVGGVVAEASGALVDVSWRSVEPDFRGGWANVVLSAELADRWTALGVRVVRFSTTEGTPDTENGVKIHGFDRRAVAEHHRLELNEPDS